MIDWRTIVKNLIKTYNDNFIVKHR